MQTKRLAMLLLAFAPVGAVPLAPATASATASKRLFVPLRSEQDIFTPSILTKTYGPDRTFLFSRPEVRRFDLEQLDRWGHAPTLAVPESAGETGRLEHESTPSVAELSEEEQRALQPPQAGVQVGIPSAAAATGAALGGIVLLVQVLAALF